MNVIEVNIAGKKERILMVRDVSHLIYLKKLVQTKISMCEFTENAMQDLEK